MKKMFLSGLVIALLTTATSSTNAQLNYKSNKPGPAFSFKPDEVLARKEINNPGAIHPNARKNFILTFEHATDARWSKLKYGESLVHFFSNGIETKVFYNRKGKPFSTIRYYTEDQLPTEVRHLVRSTFYDYSIFLVIEVTVNNQTAHLVKIEDNTRFKTIRVRDGEMDVIEDLEKK